MILYVTLKLALYFPACQHILTVVISYLFYFSNPFKIAMKHRPTIFLYFFSFLYRCYCYMHLCISSFIILIITLNCVLVLLPIKIPWWIDDVKIHAVNDKIIIELLKSTVIKFSDTDLYALVRIHRSNLHVNRHRFSNLK